MAEGCKQRQEYVGRNLEIYRRRLDGYYLSQIADEFHLSEQRVSQIIRQVVAAITPDEQANIRKMRVDFLDSLRQLASDAARQDPPHMYAPNGKELPAIDYEPRLKAIDRLLKIDERYAKLTGTDAAQQHTVQVTAEAQQATKDQADKISESLRHLIPESPEVRAYAGSD
jgi:hypothetical protein